MAKKTIRTFIYEDDKSNKFWTIEIDGKGYTVNYGKTGTNGQTSSKEFDTTDDCQKAAEKVIKEKLGKGYKEVQAAKQKNKPKMDEKVESLCKEIEKAWLDQLDGEDKKEFLKGIKKLEKMSMDEITEIAKYANGTVEALRTDAADNWVESLSNEEKKEQLYTSKVSDSCDEEKLLTEYLKDHPDESEDDYDELEFFSYCFENDEDFCKAIYAEGLECINNDDSICDSVDERASRDVGEEFNLHSKIIYHLRWNI
jgi:predicted DNA-binding WGR domain protein